MTTRAPVEVESGRRTTPCIAAPSCRCAAGIVLRCGGIAEEWGLISRMIGLAGCTATVPGIRGAGEAGVYCSAGCWYYISLSGVSE